MKDLIKEIRPRHWIKNALVFAAFFFALGDKAQSDILYPLVDSGSRVTLAAILFCLISSGIYVMNDIRDVAIDRVHPTKKERPVAAGRISIGKAWLISIVLLTIGLAGSYFIAPALLCVTAGYVALQVVYSFFLKRIAMLDVIVISIGFVLRALAGAVTLGVTISSWLILCTFMLALFLGFCKRSREKTLLETDTGENRPSLAKYDERLLNQLIAISASATIVSYALYTLSDKTIDKFGSPALGFTIPFVLFGIFRYLDLVYRHEKGDKPEQVLLTDIPILVDVALFGLTVLSIFYWR